MIPYFELKLIPFLNSDTFSFFFFMAFVGGYVRALAYGSTKGFSKVQLTEFSCLTMLPACFGAHIFHVIAYAPYKIISNPEILFQFNKGLSSMGGIFSYLLFFYLFLLFKGQTKKWKDWFDIAAQGLITGLIIGRIGCTLVHDHIGEETTFFLGIRFPDAVRHDLGFYELIYLSFFLLPFLLFVSRKFQYSGLQAALTLCLYAPVRFMLDSLRIEDRLYYGFTPAQYVCVLIFFVGIFIFISATKSGYTPEST